MVKYWTDTVCRKESQGWTFPSFAIDLNLSEPKCHANTICFFQSIFRCPGLWKWIHWCSRNNCYSCSCDYWFIHLGGYPGRAVAKAIEKRLTTLEIGRLSRRLCSKYSLHNCLVNKVKIWLCKDFSRPFQREERIFQTFYTSTPVKWIVVA